MYILLDGYDTMEIGYIALWGFMGAGGLWGLRVLLGLRGLLFI